MIFASIPFLIETMEQQNRLTKFIDENKSMIIFDKIKSWEVKK